MFLCPCPTSRQKMALLLPSRVSHATFCLHHFISFFGRNGSLALQPSPIVSMSLMIPSFLWLHCSFLPDTKTKRRQPLATAPNSSSIAKRRSSAKIAVPTSIAVRAADIQPRTPIACASLSARASSCSCAMPPVVDAREGTQLAPTSAAKACRRLRRVAKVMPKPSL